jgi:hypothetical protein
MDSETDDVLRQSFVDGSYSFNGGVLNISSSVFQGQNSAHHVRLVREAWSAGIPTEVPQATSPSAPPLEKGKRLYVHRVAQRPDTSGRSRPLLFVDFAPHPR